MLPRYLRNVIKIFRILLDSLYNMFGIRRHYIKIFKSYVILFCDSPFNHNCLRFLQTLSRHYARHLYTRGKPLLRKMHMIPGKKQQASYKISLVAVGFFRKVQEIPDERFATSIRAISFVFHKGHKKEIVENLIEKTYF